LSDRKEWRFWLGKHFDSEKEITEMREEAKAWQLAGIDAWLKHEKE